MRKMEQKLEKPMFTTRMLFRLMIPLMLEQLLLVTVGMADTMMVAKVGQAAVSGISLVDQLNTLLIQIFAALATGGAVVASQYLGRKDRDSACQSARQLVYIVLLISCSVGAIAVLFNQHLLRIVFGNVEAEVMQAANTYFWLSALSYPFIALYNAGAALFRSMGNSKVSLFAALVMNVVNIGGNAIFIYGFQMGVAGAALSSLISRTIACAMMMYLLHNPDMPIYLRDLLHFDYKKDIVKSILRIGVPSGLENGMFQFGKLLVASLIASFGTTAIAANAICNNIASFSNIPGSAVSLSMITVVGQCVGAKEYKQARGYVKLLLKMAYIGMGVVNVATILLASPLVQFYGMPQATTELAIEVLIVNCIVSSVIWQPSFIMPNALRAAGDTKYTMMVSAISMWIFRVGMSYVLGQWFDMGLMGVWLAMMIDWLVRGIAFIWRFKGDKWEKIKVLA